MNVAPFLVLGVGLAFVGLLVAVGPEDSPRRDVVKPTLAVQFRRMLRRIGEELLPVLRRAFGNIARLQRMLERQAAARR